MAIQPITLRLSRLSLLASGKIGQLRRILRSAAVEGSKLAPMNGSWSFGNVKCVHGTVESCLRGLQTAVRHAFYHRIELEQGRRSSDLVLDRDSDNDNW